MVGIGEAGITAVILSNEGIGATWKRGGIPQCPT